MNYEEVENMEKSYQDIEEMIYYLGKLCREKAILKCGEEEQVYDEGINLSKEIREILVNLTLFQCQILLNDYFVPINKNWWKGIYEKPYYEQQKNIAVHAFYRCLNT